MFPYIPLGDWLLLDSWRVMITVGILGGSLVSFFLLQGEMGRFRAGLLVASVVLGALFGGHLAHWILHPGLSGWDLSGILVFWRDGHSLLGALAFCALLLLAISRIVPHVSFWPTADAFSLGGAPRPLFRTHRLLHEGMLLGNADRRGTSLPRAFGEARQKQPAHAPSGSAVQRRRPPSPSSASCSPFAEGARPRGFSRSSSFSSYASARFLLEFFRGDTSTLFAGLTLSPGGLHSPLSRRELSLVSSVAGDAR